MGTAPGFTRGSICEVFVRVRCVQRRLANLVIRARQACRKSLFRNKMPSLSREGIRIDTKAAS